MTTAAFVLIVEDDDGHATLIARTLRRSGMVPEPLRLRDGQELLDFLYRRAAWSNRSALGPVAIIADLKMPRLNGMDVLERLKQDAVLARIPVVMLSTTDNPVDIDRCYELGAAAYLTKPIDYGLFGDMVRRLADFLSTVRLPAEARAVDRRHGV